MTSPVCTETHRPSRTTRAAGCRPMATSTSARLNLGKDVIYSPRATNQWPSTSMCARQHFQSSLMLQQRSRSLTMSLNQAVLVDGHQSAFLNDELAAHDT